MNVKERAKQRVIKFSDKFKTIIQVLYHEPTIIVFSLKDCFLLKDCFSIDLALMTL